MFNPSVTSVTPGMVKKFEISSMCIESSQCQHSCKIVLSDGREKNVTLAKGTIRVLIKGIANRKISNEWGSKHFDNSDQIKETAENILTSAFNK